MTPDQHLMARRAMGLPNPKKCTFRNRHFANNDSTSYKLWMELVADGKAGFHNNGSGFTMFWLTLEGGKEALLPGETMDPEDFERDAQGNKKAPV
jgi:hypothetical protein